MLFRSMFTCVNKMKMSINAPSFAVCRRTAVIALGFVLANCSLDLSNQAFADNSSNWFSFPSGSARSSSVSGALVASYKDPGVDEDGIHAYRFSIYNSKGPEVSGFTFLRSVEGAWSDSGDVLFVNNYIGSNVTDCLVLEAESNQFRFESLTNILNNKIQSGPMGDLNIKPPENPNNSHYYLTCDGWLDGHSLKVTLSGTTDAGGDFKYRFVFDAAAEKFTTAR